MDFRHLEGTHLDLLQKDEGDLNVELFMDLARKVLDGRLLVQLNTSGDWANTLDDEILERLYSLVLLDDDVFFSNNLPYILFYLIHLETGQHKLALTVQELEDVNRNLNKILLCEYLSRKGRDGDMKGCSIYTDFECGTRLPETSLPTSLKQN